MQMRNVMSQMGEVNGAGISKANSQPVSKIMSKQEMDLFLKSLDANQPELKDLDELQKMISKTLQTKVKNL